MFVEWAEFERTWFDSGTEAIRSTAASNPSERFYAGAFWLLYGDQSSLLIPAFGLNSEDSDPSIRWHPPDWRWSTLDGALERVRPLYEPLRAFEVDEATYELLWAQHVDMLARVSRRLTALVRSQHSSAFSRGFFVGIIDFSHGDAGIDYLKRSVDAETIASSGILAEAT